MLGLNVMATFMPIVSCGSFGSNRATSLGFRVLIGKRQELDGPRFSTAAILVEGSPNVYFHAKDSLDGQPRQRTKQAIVWVEGSVDRQVGRIHKPSFLKGTATRVKSFPHTKDDSKWFSHHVPLGFPNKGRDSSHSE